MTKFLFWNLNKREIPGFVGTLAREVGVDVLILAECVMRPERVLEQLNAETSDYQYAWGVSDHLIFFTRFDAHCLRPLPGAPGSAFCWPNLGSPRPQADATQVSVQTRTRTWGTCL